ncbi:cysteine proteinase [Rhizopus microsporus var. microsporus]|uniref:ubiquitinyl hydrolase 1 n=2 Tax=Rhizopus microsporus TaxID=58291 RepID=A0A2G4SP34_RHIZD|nr:cysteine proteinase [Rhizopus microsporus ATCC 52813]ORE08941.1 cysteine proteinase [Rhizopus microsporus var. microsporus]PHZ10531.1 cysteine proteinase [Rhizopus microsporus ATCC 52813]
MSSEEPVLSDEQILEFEQQIKDEEAQRVPLVCQDEPISKLEEEFKDNQQFLNKIKNLAQEHDRIRRCRGDGNCFFRAIAFSWYEKAMNDISNYDTNLARLKESCSLLEYAQFQKLAYEDFYEVACEQFERLGEYRNDPDMLLVNFQSYEISNTIITYFRFVTSAYLRIHSAEYEPFIVDEMISIDEFCSRNVEAFGSESDHLQIIAISKAMDIPIHIVYLDGGMEDKATVHEFWPTEKDELERTKIPIKLLYRPGHYDILYQK